MMDEYKEDKSWLSRLRKPADPNRFNNDTRLEALEERVEALENPKPRPDDPCMADVAEPRSEVWEAVERVASRVPEPERSRIIAICRERHGTPGPSDTQDGLDRTLTKIEALVRDSGEFPETREFPTRETGTFQETDLVERVADILQEEIGDSLTASTYYRYWAKAAIREVADALEEASKGALWVPGSDALAWLRSNLED